LRVPPGDRKRRVQLRDGNQPVQQRNQYHPADSGQLYQPESDGDFAMVRAGKMSYRRRSAGDAVMDSFVLLSMIFVLVITLYPFVYIISMSISGQGHVLNKSIWLYPKDISLHAYRQVFANPNLWQSYYNTIFYTFFGT